MAQQLRTPFTSQSTSLSSSGMNLTTHTVELSGLPTGLNGITIAQISDLHRSGAQTDRLICEAISRVNALKPDVVAITGDFVDHHSRDIDAVVDMVSGLESRLGVYACVGNHDHRADAKLLVRQLIRAGIHVLDNQAKEIQTGLWLAGIDDLYEGEADLDSAMRMVPDNVALVLLAHHPNTLDIVDSNRSQLILSGHTHGGQIVLPFPTPSMICRYHLKTRFVEGWYKRGAAQLYVNRGIGATGFGPLARRRRCPPEISLFSLNAPAAG